MFNDFILETIYSITDINKIPIGYQAEMLRIFEEALEKMGVNINELISESEY